MIEGDRGKERPKRRENKIIPTDTPPTHDNPLSPSEGGIDFPLGRKKPSEIERKFEPGSGPPRSVHAEITREREVELGKILTAIRESKKKIVAEKLANELIDKHVSTEERKELLDARWRVE